MPALLRFALRLLARVAIATWFGGFTFYAAAVVPDLHDHLGGLETGEVSRRVAVILYAIGGAALFLGSIEFATDRELRRGRMGKARLGLIVANALLLVGLVALHRSLGARLDGGESLSTFRTSHERYLMVWTAQWLAILGWMGLDVRLKKSSGP